MSELGSTASASSGRERRISLVMGSIARLERLKRFAQSLPADGTVGVELIVVEQVAPEEARTALSESRVVAVVVESERGLSRARNRGLEEARGDLVGFPDDDCWYEPETLAKIRERFDGDPELGVLVGRQLTAAGGSVLRTPSSERLVDRSTVWRVAMSSAVFFRRDVIDRVGWFDPQLGVGSGTRLGAGEETDLVLRAMAAGAKVLYTPDLVVRHPEASETDGRQSPAVGTSYGQGMGYVLATRGYGPATALWHVLRPVVGSVVAVIRGDRPLAAFRWAVAGGRLRGYVWGRRAR